MFLDISFQFRNDNGTISACENDRPNENSMPDKPDQRAAPNSGGTLSRRDVLGLGVATALLAASRQLGASEGSQVPRPGQSPSEMTNQGSVAEFSADRDGALVLTSFRNAFTQFEWIVPSKTFAPAVQYADGTSASWRPLPGTSTSRSDQNSLTVRAASGGGLESRLTVAAYADTGAFRWQQYYLNTGRETIRTITRIGAMQFDLRPDLGPLVVHCVRRDGDYNREALPFKSRLQIEGGDWNAPVYTGSIVIEAAGRSEFLVIGVQQERGWTFVLEELRDCLRMSVTAHDMEKNIARRGSLSACPLFIGACGPDLDTAVNVGLAHLRQRILPAALPAAPWVSYNIWSTDAKDVEKNILDEVPFAASMGVDLFYLDASWYKGSSTRGNGDWGKGLGSYTEDRSKFPHGLRYLSDQVHAAGMKFGLWVGPNIVDATLVPHEVPPSWLAMVDGKQVDLKIPTWENTCLQVCMGSSGYAEHLKQSLARLVEDFDLDWLKWDNSGIPALPARCNRGDHGHGPHDGSASALDNEYEIFRYLHEKFPKLALEQCGYGSRLDYGLADTIRANWCSDTCYPASRLRSNSLVCASVYPSAYNAAWIVREDTELFDAKSDPIIDAAIRSRMIGLFGVGTLNGQMSQRASLYPKKILDRLADNVGLYKRFRHLLFQQVSFPYQPYGTDPQGWQAIQFTAVSGSEAVLLCFRAASTQTTSSLKLSRLHPIRNYSVKCIDGGTESKLTGSELMDTGIYLSLPDPGASEILLINEA
jgi:alpha-galactosidase